MIRQGNKYYPAQSINYIFLVVSFLVVSTLTVSFLVLSTVVFEVESTFTVVESTPPVAFFEPQAANVNTAAATNVVLIMFFMMFIFKCYFALMPIFQKGNLILIN